MAPDKITLAYVQGRALRPISSTQATPGSYSFEKTYDASKMEPLVAAPPSPENVMPVRSWGK